MRDAEAHGWANPSSVHRAGRESRALLERARADIAGALGGDASDVVLTAGGTEACNLGVLGLLQLNPGRVVTTAVEHPAMGAPLALAERSLGCPVTRLPVPGGRPPEASELRAALTPDTRLVAIQWINHETGTCFPVGDYARVCRDAGVPLLVDANQALGKLPIDVRALDVAALACSAHKLGGPAGAGALWVRRGLDLDPRMLGGGQERGRRAGTPNVVASVGFGAACQHVARRIADMPRITTLRDRMEDGLRALGATRNAPDGPRVATVSNVYVSGWRGEALVAALDLEGLCVSSGAACSSGLAEPSPVLLAMHADEPARAASSLRFSFGPETTESDVDSALTILRRVLSRPAA
jgi:cysteine desulfurase